MGDEEMVGLCHPRPQSMILVCMEALDEELVYHFFFDSSFECILIPDRLRE